MAGTAERPSGINVKLEVEENAEEPRQQAVRSATEVIDDAPEIQARSVRDTQDRPTEKAGQVQQLVQGDFASSVPGERLASTASSSSSISTSNSHPNHHHSRHTSPASLRSLSPVQSPSSHSAATSSRSLTSASSSGATQNSPLLTSSNLGKSRYFDDSSRAGSKEPENGSFTSQAPSTETTSSPEGLQTEFACGNTLSNLGRLPSEALLLTFTYLFEGLGTPYADRSINHLLPYTRVCKSWRNLIYQEVSFWRRIGLEIMSDLPSSGRLAFLIDRTMNAPTPSPSMSWLLDNAASRKAPSPPAHGLPGLRRLHFRIHDPTLSQPAHPNVESAVFLQQIGKMLVSRVLSWFETLQPVFDVFKAPYLHPLTSPCTPGIDFSLDLLGNTSAHLGILSIILKLLACAPAPVKSVKLVLHSFHTFPLAEQFLQYFSAATGIRSIEIQAKGGRPLKQTRPNYVMPQPQLSEEMWQKQEYIRRYQAEKAAIEARIARDFKAAQNVQQQSGPMAGGSMSLLAAFAAVSNNPFLNGGSKHMHPTREALLRQALPHIPFNEAEHSMQMTHHYRLVDEYKQWLSQASHDWSRISGSSMPNLPQQQMPSLAPFSHLSRLHLEGCHVMPSLRLPSRGFPHLSELELVEVRWGRGLYTFLEVCRSTLKVLKIHNLQKDEEELLGMTFEEREAWLNEGIVIPTLMDMMPRSRPSTPTERSQKRRKLDDKATAHYGQGRNGHDTRSSLKDQRTTSRSQTPPYSDVIDIISALKDNGIEEEVVDILADDGETPDSVMLQPSMPTRSDRSTAADYMRIFEGEDDDDEIEDSEDEETISEGSLDDEPDIPNLVYTYPPHLSSRDFELMMNPPRDTRVSEIGCIKRTEQAEPGQSPNPLLYEYFATMDRRVQGVMTRTQLRFRTPLAWVELQAGRKDFQEQAQKTAKLERRLAKEISRRRTERPPPAPIVLPVCHTVRFTGTTTPALWTCVDDSTFELIDPANSTIWRQTPHLYFPSLRVLVLSDSQDMNQEVMAPVPEALAEAIPTLKVHRAKSAVEAKDRSKLKRVSTGAGDMVPAYRKVDEITAEDMIWDFNHPLPGEPEDEELYDEMGDEDLEYYSDRPYKLWEYRRDRRTADGYMDKAGHLDPKLVKLLTKGFGIPPPLPAALTALTATSGRDLVELNLSNSVITNGKLQSALAYLPNLDRLILVGVESLEDFSLSCIPNCCPRLAYLDIRGAYSLTACGVAPLVEQIRDASDGLFRIRKIGVDNPEINLAGNWSAFADLRKQAQAYGYLAWLDLLIDDELEGWKKAKAEGIPFSHKSGKRRRRD